MIDLTDISYSYPDAPALSNLDLHIERGEAVAVMGPNGSGKSTLLKLLNGIVFPDSGSYRYDGEEITQRRLKDPKLAKTFHQRIGLLFQNSDAQLFCTSVYDEVAFGPRQMFLEEDEVDRRVRECLGLFDIEALGARVPYHLSGGEKRKVAFACVLSLNPDVLVLDEPMNGLDPRTKSFLRQTIIELNRAGKTIICSTHDFKYVEGVFKKAVVLSDGHRIVRIGPYEDTLADEPFLRAHNIL